VSPGTSADGPEVTLAHGVLRAWERRDLDWLVEHSTPDVELRPFMWTDLPFRGIEGTTAFVKEYLAVRTPLKIEVERVRKAADPVALDVHLRGHLHMSDADFDEHPTFVFWVRDGKLARYEGHVDPAAIEEAAARSLADGS
jgi:ketosteroid isomerase-like protein